MRLPVPALQTDGSFCLSGEKITMRDVNSWLRQGNLAVAENSDRDAPADDSVSKCREVAELLPSELVQKGDLTQRKRRRKRKHQESINIQSDNPNAYVAGVDRASNEAGVTVQSSGNQGKIRKRIKAKKESGSTRRGGSIMQHTHLQRKRKKPMPNAPLNVSTVVREQKKISARRKKEQILLDSGKETLREPQETNSQMKAENENLRRMVENLQNQLEFVYTVAGQGSENCHHCRILKDKADELYKKFPAEKPLAVEPVLKIIPVAPIQPLSTDSCMERVIEIDGTCEKATVAFQGEENPKNKEFISALINLTNPLAATVPCKTDANRRFEEDSDAECDLFVELTSQTDDSDYRSKEDGKADEIRSEECVSKECPDNLNSLHEGKVEERRRSEDSVSKERAVSQNNLNGFHKASEAKTKNDFACSANEIDAHGFQDGSGDITQNSYGTFDIGIEKQGQDEGYIDLKCGCTSQKFGDTIGILRLYQNGMLEIYCQCCTGCIKGKPMSPSKFEKHGGRGSSKKWRESIWVVLGDRKVIFSKVKGLDAFVRRYRESRARIKQARAVRVVYHRDEFLQCSKCSKKRRFPRKSKEECRLFHDSAMNPEWECSMYPFDRSLSCEHDEEREVRQSNRGCMQSRSCQGCIHCICLGCSGCRFVDCTCQICQEFMTNCGE